MPEPHRRYHQHGKPKMWKSLRRRLSGSPIIKRNEDITQPEDEGSRHEILLQLHSKQQTGTRVSSQKSGRYGHKVRGASPSCLKSRQLPRSSGVLPAFLCSPSHQRFTPLIDDYNSRSTRATGLVVEHNQRYSEIWLADYAARPRKGTSSATSARGASLKDNVADGGRGASDVAGTRAVGKPPPIPVSRRDSLRKDVDRLAMNMSKVSVRDPVLGNRSQNSNRHSTSPTSHTSSIDSSEFSFNPDFTQMDESSSHSAPAIAKTTTGSSPEMTSDCGRCELELRTEISNSFDTIIPELQQLQAFDDDLKRRNERMHEVGIGRWTAESEAFGKPHDIETSAHLMYQLELPKKNIEADQSKSGFLAHTQPLVTTLDSPCGVDAEAHLMYQFVPLNGKTNLSGTGYPVDRFGPILAESHQEGEPIPLGDCFLDIPSPSRADGERHQSPQFSNSAYSEEQVAIDELGNAFQYSEEDVAIDQLSNEFVHGVGEETEQHLDASYDICSQYVNYSFDQSNHLSEMAEMATYSSGEALVNREFEEIWTEMRNETICRKVKCVVVHDMKWRETDPNNNDGVPSAHVRAMWVKYEALKRLEADHAEKFGYKDFFPIHEPPRREGN